MAEKFVVTDVRVQELPVPKISGFSSPEYTNEPWELDEAGLKKVRGRVFLCTCGKYHPTSLHTIKSLKQWLPAEGYYYQEGTRGGYPVLNANKPW